MVLPKRRRVRRSFRETCFAPPNDRHGCRAGPIHQGWLLGKKSCKRDRSIWQNVVIASEAKQFVNIYGKVLRKFYRLLRRCAPRNDGDKKHHPSRKQTLARNEFIFR